ncbi:hypothetical protein [Lyngbya sp. PCC 8106]|uniref:hypothetical protein n=1 Tax=Lyngbya sp. (strain PCC 8106) TaxID=313612 RepID=UPI0000EA95AB|nr:hypothetical protein [Lyngbya sp. PCC 8106]EAW35046.1 hypothetical protein L8106_08021 [Lyngbya sp. PCC 8106]
MQKAKNSGKCDRSQAQSLYLGVETREKEIVKIHRFHQTWKKPPFYYEPKKLLEVVFKRRTAQV